MVGRADDDGVDVAAGDEIAEVSVRGAIPRAVGLVDKPFCSLQVTAVHVASGQHLGGYIYPGPSTMLESLRRETQLPVPERLAGNGQPGGNAIAPGATTADCIGHGVFAAQLGALALLEQQLEKAASGPAQLIVTGGAADELLPQIARDHTHDPWLVFRGMLVD